MELTFEQHSACASTVARGSSITTPPRDCVSSPPYSRGIGLSPRIIAERARKARLLNTLLPSSGASNALKP